MLDKKLRVILVGAFVILVVCWGLLIGHTYAFNNETHTLLLTKENMENGKYSDGNVAIRLGARGEDTNQISTWTTVEGRQTDAGWVPVRSYEAVIYEMEIENLSESEISDWGFRVGLSEDGFLNGGWNGDFKIHQTSGVTASEQLIGAGEFKPDFVTLEHFNVNDVFLIPLKKGDFFEYIPVAHSQEIPIVAAIPKKHTTYSKTIGFVLYIEDKEEGYTTTFSDGYVTYKMHLILTEEPIFYILLALSCCYVAWIVIILLFIRKDRIFIEKRAHDMAIIEQSMQVFIEFIEAKDPSTKGHSLRVAKYARNIARYLGMPEEECQNIYYIGMLHDVGKVTIPESILCKPAGLSEEEYALMKSHSQRGYEMLQKFDAIPSIGDGALCHHERYDGKGYPNGLKGSEIPFVGRLICVADAFDAMTGIRCYQQPLPKEEVIRKLKEDRGKHFDPVIVDALLSIFESGGFEALNK